MSEHKGTFIEAADNRDEAYRIASEHAKRLTKLGAKGFMVGVRPIGRHLFHIELWRTTNGALIFPAARHSTESDPS
jgi:hypothetical protein